MAPIDGDEEYASISRQLAVWYQGFHQTYVNELDKCLASIFRVERLIRERYPILIGKLWQNDIEFTRRLDPFSMATAYREVLGGVLAVNPQKRPPKNSHRTNTTVDRDVEFALEFSRDHIGQTVSYFAELKRLNRPAMSLALKRGKEELAKREKSITAKRKSPKPR